MKIFDSHAHFNDERFKNDIFEVLKICEENNVKKIVNIATNITDSKELISFTDYLNDNIKNIDFYFTMGIHPDEINYKSQYINEDFYNDNGESGIEFKKLDNLVSQNIDNKKFIAIGEIGLDYYGDNKKDISIREKQKLWFINQLNLAKKYDLPVSIHSRDAVDETYNILKTYYSDKKAVIHCYSYSKEYLIKFIELGFYIGIGGVLTFKNGIKLKEVAKICPLDKIVLETDSPYLAPMPHRGERNNSSYIKYVLKELAEIKNIDEEELSNICYNNTLELYNLED